MKIESFIIHRDGPKGKSQDAFLDAFEIHGAYWCAIADGVGRSSNGGVAARLSMDTVAAVASADTTMPAVFSAVAERLSSEAENQPELEKMSTTLSVLCIKGSNFEIGHVGDTRISHLRNGGIMTRTKDQTEVQKLLDEGVLTKHQAKRYPRRNVIISAMSPKRDYDLLQGEFHIEHGDRILLTSDGFHSKLLRGQLAGLSQGNSTFEDFCGALEAEISMLDLEDDATCIALEIKET